MSDQPTPLNDEDLNRIVVGASAGANSAFRLSSLDDKGIVHDIHAVTALMQQAAQESRNAAREGGGAQTSAQIDLLKRVAADLRQT